MGTWERTSERQAGVVAGVEEAEGLELDGGWGRVSRPARRFSSLLPVVCQA